MVYRGSEGVFVIITTLVLMLISPAVVSAVEGSGGLLQRSVVREVLIGEEPVSMVTRDYLSKQPVDSLIDWIVNFDDYPHPDIIGWLFKLTHVISDTLQAPFFVYVPTGYDPASPTPLMVWLHGGVYRPEFINEINQVTGHPIIDLCEETGMILLFPAGKAGCLWWDDTGIANLQWQIREMKRRYNIDDDHVFLGGFSDGASGSFHLAMLTPTDFAVFFPWSGNMAVGSLVGKMPVYLPNMSCRPVFATNGGKDGLYPSERMLPFMKLALEHGCELYFTSYDTAGHNYGYLSLEWRPFAERVKAFSRKPLRPRLVWETSDLKYGGVDWLEVTALDTGRRREEWHVDVNRRMTNDRVTIGFNADSEWEGEGVCVASVSQDTSLPAYKIGLQKGDVVIGLDDIPVADLRELSDAKATKKRGETVRIKLKRGEEILDFESQFPPINEYDAFVRTSPSGAVQAVRIGNRFEIKASRVSGLRLKLCREMIRWDQPVEVLVNGEVVFKDLVKPDINFMLDEFAGNRDKRLLWLAKIDLEL